MSSFFVKGITSSSSLLRQRTQLKSPLLTLPYISLISQPKYFRCVSKNVWPPSSTLTKNLTLSAKDNLCATGKVAILDNFINLHSQSHHRNCCYHSLLATDNSPLHKPSNRRYGLCSNSDLFHHKAKGQWPPGQFYSSASENSSSRGDHDLVTAILEATEKMDVMAGSLRPSDVQQLIQELYSFGFKPWTTERLLSGKLWLLKQPRATLTLCDLFLDHGMSPDLVCDAIHNIPYSHQKDLHRLPDLVNQILFLLRNFGFSEKEIYAIVARRDSSSVLLVDESSVRMALARVKALFPTQDTKKVVCTSPNVLWEDWPVVQAKFDYCIFTMGYTQTDIVRSGLFSHSLRHIQDRHVFLQRANVFKIVNKKLHPSLNPNPPLKRVVDTPDFVFVKLVEGVSVQDYATFRKMAEVERREAEISENEEEGEEEENEFEEAQQTDDDEEDNEGKNSNFNAVSNSKKGENRFKNKNAKTGSGRRY